MNLHENGGTEPHRHPGFVSNNLEWITKHLCPSCGQGWLCRWDWWLECSKCDERYV